MMSLLFAGMMDHNDNAVETGMNVQRKGSKRDVRDILSTRAFPFECNGTDVGMRGVAVLHVRL